MCIRDRGYLGWQDIKQRYRRSVLGPLFGAAVLAVSDWRTIFAINLAVGLVLAAAIRTLAPRSDRRSRGRVDVVGVLLLLATFASAAVVFLRPASLMRDLTWGQLFIPFAGDGRWLTPLGALTTGALLLLVAWCWFGPRPLLDLRGWGRVLLEADLVGALLLAAALGGVILAFATADPKIEVFSPRGRWYLLGALVATAAFAWHVRRAANPLVPRGALRRTPAWGALLVSFFVGAALIAALIDIPLFARTTVYPDDQLPAALVLVRFLLALPVGAVLGGYLIRFLSPGIGPPACCSPPPASC